MFSGSYININSIYIFYGAKIIELEKFCKSNLKQWIGRGQRERSRLHRTQSDEIIPPITEAAPGAPGEIQRRYTVPAAAQVSASVSEVTTTGV